MDTRAFIEFCGREEARLQWYVGAREIAEQMLQFQRDADAARQARDQAYKDRDAAVNDIKTRQARDAKTAAGAIESLQKELARRQTAADQELARTQAELAALRENIERAQAAKAQVVTELARVREATAREGQAITERIESLRAEERSIKERFAAALK